MFYTAALVAPCGNVFMRGSALIRSLRAMATALLLVLTFSGVSQGRHGEPHGGRGGNGGDIEDDRAPQFDMGTAGAAFSLLAGSFLVLRARRHRRKSG